MNTSPIPKNLRILIVDDNRGIHEDFHKILGEESSPQSAHAAAAEALLFGEPNNGATADAFELDSAYQGIEGLEFIQRARAAGHPYAVVFMDVRMPPGWDGIETTARIWEVDPDVQVVLCTAFSDYSWDEMRKKLGRPDRLLILKKPFDNVEVLQLATALTEKWRLRQQTHQQVGQLEERVRQRTAELSQSEKRYRLITENAGDLIEIIDARGRPLYRSPSFERLLGHTPPEHAKSGAFETVHPDDQEVVAASTRASLENGAQQVFDFRARRQDGTWLVLEAHCGPFRNEGGTIEGVLIVSRDVTERRKLEQQLRQAQKLEAIGQLATGIAHEINTPTQFIGNNAHFLEGAFADLQALLVRYDELLTAAEAGAITPELLASVRAARTAASPEYLATEVPKAIGDTLMGVARTAKIVKAMRTFAHPGTAQKTKINLREAVEDALTITRNEWWHVADTITEFDPALPAVPVLPGEFGQVLINLIVNATHTIADRLGKGSSDKGTLTLSAHRDGDWVEVRVRDTGMGIPEKVRDRIYDPFFTTKAVGKGTGQGLAIARAIIADQHGGSLTFETEEGKGTVFIIRLPVSPDSETKQEAVKKLRS